MMAWIARLFGRESNQKEDKAVEAEEKVDDLEEQAVEQQRRLDVATKRVTKAIKQVERVEQLARERRR